MPRLRQFPAPLRAHELSPELQELLVAVRRDLGDDVHRALDAPLARVRRAPPEACAGDKR